MSLKEFLSSLQNDKVDVDIEDGHTDYVQLKDKKDKEQVHVFDGKKYKGTKVSKQDIAFLNDGENVKRDLISEESESSEIEIEDEDFNEDEEDNEDEINGEEVNDKSEMSEDEEFDELSGSDDDNNVEIMAAKSSGPEEQLSAFDQALHAQRQMKLYGQIFGMRIRMQPLMLKFSRLPNKSALQNSDLQLNAKLKNLREDALSILNTFRGLQSDLNLVPSTGSVSANLSKDELWQKIKENNAVIENEVALCFDKWQERTHFAFGTANKSSNINQPISVQVNETLASSKVVIQRNQKAMAPSFFSRKRSWSAVEDNNLDESIYNDTAFYQQMLKDFVAMSGLDVFRKLNDNVDPQTDTTLFSNRRQKKRVLMQQDKLKSADREVDVRASKGRKLKYIVHDKLVSFLPSASDVKQVVDSERLSRLLNSLFH